MKLIAENIMCESPWTHFMHMWFNHPVNYFGVKEDLIVRLELSSSEKVILCSKDTVATHKLSDISLGYDAMFDKRYATAIGELYVQTASTPYTKVTLIHY